MKFLPVLLLLAACSGGSTCPEPFYDGKGSDEAWRTMLDGESRATKDDTKAVTFFLPTDGQQLPKDNPPTFKWSTPLTASLKSTLKFVTSERWAAPSLIVTVAVADGAVSLTTTVAVYSVKPSFLS